MSEIYKEFLSKPEIKDARPIELGEKTGIHRNNISKYLNGKSQPGLDLFEKICNALGYDLKLEKKD